MIQQSFKNNVEQTTENVTTTGFSISVNESMFQMLTSNIYNNPRLAVVREWSTNACDACIAAGKEVKFDVHLPTVEEPEFSVRDYGTGLSKEDIVGLFSNLGASTKRNSNDLNGTLGIGRMSGLAVAEAFTVESFYKGTHYSYVISMQNGVPVTMHLGDNPTTEPDGLKLSVAVELSDLSYYRENAKHVYTYFDYKPQLNMELDIELNITDQISKDWFFASNSNTNSNYVLMSQVLYEIPRNSAVDHQNLSSLIIRVAPGEVTFNPGRESLSLDKKTIDHLNALFVEIAAQYVDKTNASFTLCNNDVEIADRLIKAVASMPYTLTSRIESYPFFSATAKTLLPNNSITNNVLPSSRVLMTEAFTSLSGNLLKLLSKSRYKTNGKVIESGTGPTVATFFTSEHVIIDVKSNFRDVLKSEYSNSDAIYWQRKDKADITKATKKAEELLTSIGLPYTLLSSKMDMEAIKEQRKNKTVRLDGFYASSMYNGSFSRGTLLSEKSVTSISYLYVKLKNTTPILEDKTTSFDEYLTLYNKLNIINNDVPELKGVAKKYQPIADELDNWIDFETYIRNTVKTTTFHVEVEHSVPVLRHNIINRDNFNAFPKKLEDFAYEIYRYQDYKMQDTYTRRYLKPLLEKFNAFIEEYEPERDIDLDELENMFPQSYKLIINNGEYHTNSHKLVLYVAKLEEFYAIHSTEERHLYSADE